MIDKRDKPYKEECLELIEEIKSKLENGELKFVHLGYLAENGNSGRFLCSFSETNPRTADAAIFALSIERMLNSFKQSVYDVEEEVEEEVVRFCTY